MRTNIRRVVPFLLPLALVACGTTNPPRELSNARMAYERASSGVAATNAPVELRDAKIALDRANQSFRDDGASGQTKDLGYVAERKALRAEAVGRTGAALRDQAVAEAERTKILTALAERGMSAEEVARKAREEASMTKEQLAEKQKKLDEERAAREAAEARARDAVDALAKAGEVKTEPRGIVLTLSGSVLFAFGKSELLPAARDRLNDVAEALKQTGESTFVVEGHTDNVGTDADNLALSQRRADAVRAYLVSRGVSSAKIKAVGHGESTPVDTNATVDGRAINRRVEIVVQNPPGQTGTQTGGGPPTSDE